jgi:hypothetical protein
MSFDRGEVVNRMDRMVQRVSLLIIYSYIIGIGDWLVSDDTADCFFKPCCFAF